MAGYVSLPSYQVPRNAMLDFSGLNEGIDAINRRNENDRLSAERADERKYQRGRNAMADARYADEAAYRRGRDTLADTRYADETTYNRGRQATADSRAATEFSNQQEDRAQNKFTDRVKLMAPHVEKYVVAEKDPAMRAKRWSEVLSLPGMENAPPQFQDPVAGPDLFMATAKRFTGDSKAPSSVQEWEYYQNLTPDERDQFSALKRQNNILVGDTILNRTTGQPVANVGDALTRGAIAKGEGKDIAETRADLPEAKLRLQMVTGGMDRLERAATNLATMPGLDKVVGGLYQTYMPNVTEDALNAETELENLKVKISGVVLQSMRDMSKTGGAVGQVTEREWPRLENMIANLDPKQGMAQFMANLKGVVSYAQSVKAQLQAAYDADVAKAQGGGQAPPQSAAPRPQNRPDPLNFFGGN